MENSSLFGKRAISSGGGRVPKVLAAATDALAKCLVRVKNYGAGQSSLKDWLWRRPGGRRTGR
ncbi:MAG: hypothetical protein OXL33_05965, partial [Chloroflexota bacterium]|nr:hypothetical protein [Chloroflexota bacterium]